MAVYIGTRERPAPHRCQPAQMAGTNPASVQRILRHSDRRITTELYGHLSPGCLRDEVNRSRFEPSDGALLYADEVAERRHSVAQRRAEFPQTKRPAVNAPPFGAEPARRLFWCSGLSGIPDGFSPVIAARPERFEPSSYGSGEPAGRLFRAAPRAAASPLGAMAARGSAWWPHHLAIC